MIPSENISLVNHPFACICSDSLRHNSQRIGKYFGMGPECGGDGEVVLVYQSCISDDMHGLVVVAVVVVVGAFILISYRCMIGIRLQQPLTPSPSLDFAIQSWKSTGRRGGNEPVRIRN